MLTFMHHVSTFYFVTPSVIFYKQKKLISYLLRKLIYFIKLLFPIKKQ